MNGVRVAEITKLQQFLSVAVNVKSSFIKYFIKSGNFLCDKKNLDSKIMCNIFVLLLEVFVKRFGTRTLTASFITSMTCLPVTPESWFKIFKKNYF